MGNNTDFRERGGMGDSGRGSYLSTSLHLSQQQTKHLLEGETGDNALQWGMGLRNVPQECDRQTAAHSVVSLPLRLTEDTDHQNNTVWLHCWGSWDKVNSFQTLWRIQKGFYWPKKRLLLTDLANVFTLNVNIYSKLTCQMVCLQNLLICILYLLHDHIFCLLFTKKNIPPSYYLLLHLCITHTHKNIFAHSKVWQIQRIRVDPRPDSCINVLQISTATNCFSNLSTQ